jgi:nucleoside-diphosphate kinase
VVAFSGAALASTHSASAAAAPAAAAPAAVPYTGLPGTVHERTYIMLKPDGVQRGLLPEVIRRFQDKGA